MSLRTFHLLYPFFFFFFFFWSFEVDNQVSFNAKISFPPWLFIQYVTCQVRRGKRNFWSTLRWAKLRRHGFLSCSPVCWMWFITGWRGPFGKNSVLYSLGGTRPAWWSPITSPTSTVNAWGTSFSLSQPESRVFSSFLLYQKLNRGSMTAWENPR